MTEKLLAEKELPIHSAIAIKIAEIKVQNSQPKFLFLGEVEKEKMIRDINESLSFFRPGEQILEENIFGENPTANRYMGLEPIAVNRKSFLLVA
jgi:predicted ATPase with chaperone activity